MRVGLALFPGFAGRAAENIRVARESLDGGARSPTSKLLVRLEEIDARCFPQDAWSAHTIAGQLSFPNAQLWTARDAKGVVAGFVLTTGSHADASTVTIADLAVDPDHRRQRIGERLMISALQHAKAGGATRARLHVEANNAGAQRLYQRLGFERISLCPRFYGSGRDGVLMEADLS